MKRTRTVEAAQQQEQPQDEAAKAQQRAASLKSLVVPWVSIVLVAVAAVVYSNTTTTDDTTSYQDDLSSSNEFTDGLFAARTLQQHNDEEVKVLHLDHDPLFPLSTSDVFGFTFAVVGLMIAAGGGIGGGGILVPIYILVMGFSPKHAIPLSNITVLGGAFANTILNTRKRHPLANRPLVDWDLILVMEPLTIAGALIGAFLNKLLPETLLVVMLVALLSFTAYKSLTKAVKMYRIETRRMREKESELTRIVHKEQAADDQEAKESLLNSNSSNEEEEDLENVDIDKTNTKNEDLEQILEEEKDAPMGNIVMLVTMFVVVLFINIMKGGGAFPSPLGIRCGSTSFWVANFTMFGWIVLISFMARAYLVGKWERKQACGYKYVEGDIQWDGRATIVYPVICCLAGFFAGMFGVGGGIVKGPLMLAMGVHPAVSSASSACMILFTSFTATTSFVVFGLLVPDYAPVCFCIGFVATMVGQIGLGYLMKKSNRNSYIAFSIGGVVLLSAFLMTIQSLVSMAESKHHHSGGICGRED